MFPAGRVFTGAWVSGWENRSCAGRACLLVEIHERGPVQECGEAGARTGPRRVREKDANPAHDTVPPGSGRGAEMQ